MPNDTERLAAPRRPVGRNGFTLVEILIVVLILGVLAAMVIPHFTGAAEDTRETSLREHVRGLNTIVQLYRIQHGDTFPDLIGTDWAALTTKTDFSGAITTLGNGYGPYIERAPANPLNGSVTVASAAAPGVGWVYDAGTGKLSATGRTWAPFP